MVSNKNANTLILGGVVILLALVVAAVFYLPGRGTASVLGQATTASAAGSTGPLGTNASATPYLYTGQNAALQVAVQSSATGTTAVQYLPTSVYAVYTNGVIAGSTTATGGTGLTYASINVNVGSSGTIYALGTGVTATDAVTGSAGNSVAFSAAQPQSQYVLVGANQTEFYVVPRDTNYNNVTATSNGTSTNCNSVGCSTVAVSSNSTGTYNIHLASGGSVSGYLDLNTNTTSTTFGYLPTYFVFVRGGSTNFAQTDLSLTDSNLQVTTCPSDIQNALAGWGQCWVNKEISSTASMAGQGFPVGQPGPLTSADGFRRIGYTLKASTAPAAGTTTSDKPALYVVSGVNYLNTNNAVNSGYYNSANSAVGIAPVTVTWNMA